MAEQNKLHTISSSQQEPASSQIWIEPNPVDPVKARELTKMLLRLAVTYYRPDFTEIQAKAMIADYILDLHGFETRDVEAGIRAYRKRPDAEFFPKPGILYRLSGDAQTLRLFAEREAARQAIEDAQPAKPPRPKFVSRPLMWWHRPKDRWDAGWRECDVPDGELVKDTAGAKLRPALRLSYE